MLSSQAVVPAASLATQRVPSGFIQVCSPLPHVSIVHPSKSGSLAGIVEQSSPSDDVVAYAIGIIAVCCYCCAIAI
jgi:hypothetical protein